MAAEAKADRVFLELLSSFNDQGREVSPNRSPSYAPTIFADHADAGGLGKKRRESAMNRLLEGGRIRIEKTGPPSKRRSGLIVARPKEGAGESR